MTTERPHPPAHRPEPPSDLELMMYFDGELEEPRRAEVAAFVAADLRARTKIAGLRVAAAFVDDEVKRSEQAPSPADGIADLVMARIAANGSALAAPPDVLSPASPPARPVPLPAVGLPAAAPANDNRRRVFVALGGLVAAAAAVLAVWGQRPSGSPAEPPSPVAALSTPASPTIAAPAPVAPSAPQPEIEAAAAAADEGAPGVEVAAVNFGAHMGSIFYVPSGSIEAKRTTTVVWLADDAGE